MSFRIDQLAVYNLATVGGSITAGSLVKSGGTSSQFLKADGSVDTNAYITGITSGMVTTALGYTPVPNTRTLTINGTTYDLTADRSWTISAGVTSVSGSGAGISVSPTTGAVVVSNTGVTSNVAGTGISVSGATGAVTITNTGVTSIVAGTAITISGATGAVTINNAGVTSLNGSTGALTGFATQAWVTSQGYITSASVGNGTLTLAVSGSGLSGSASFTANQSTATTFTVTSNATNANTASTIVFRDASGNFSAGTITAALSGNATTASTWQTARTLTIGSTGKSVNGSADVSWSLTEIGAPSTTGTGASGTWGISITGNSATVSTLATLGTGISYNTDRTVKISNGLAIYGAYNGGANSPWTYDLAAQFIRDSRGFEFSASWHAPSATLAFRTLRDCCDNWSSWVTMLSSSNYNSYSPTLTGGGASGTWGINITGNAGYASSAGNADTVDNFHASQSTVANNIVVRDANGYIFGNYINMTDDGNPGGGTSISSFITKQGDNYYRSVSPTNAMVSIRGVASGSWGINVTGTAGSETLATVTGRGASTSTAVSFNNVVSVTSSSIGMDWWRDGSGTYMEFYGTSTATRKLRLQGSDGSGNYAQWFIDGGNQQVYGTVTGVTNFLFNSSTVYLRYNGSDKFWTGSDGTRNAGWLYMQNGGSGIHYPGYNSHFYMPGGNYWHINPTGASSYGGLVLYSDYNSTMGGSTYRKGYLYYDGNGFGLLGGGDGAWAININPSTSKYVTIGGDSSLNAYNSTTGVRLMFGGGNSDAQGNYYIGTNLNNYGGNYNKLDLAWHTGIRIGAQTGYGGIRMYNDEDFSSLIFSVGEGDSNVRVTNNLYMGGNIVATQSWVTSQGYITGNQTITLSGDVSGSGTTSISVTVNQIDGWSFVNTGSNSGTAADSINSNGISYVSTNISLFGQTDGSLYSQAYSSSWQHQIYGDYRTGQIAIRGKNNGTWQSWRVVLDSSNYTSYAPSLTGSGASGTWSINITGSAGSASTASQVTINYNNDSNSTYQLLWGSGNSVYGTSQVYVNPSSDVIYARGGYISPGNPWGTADSAFFPNGITTAAGTNWVYGHTYLGNAPSNGSGAEVSSVGRIYVRNGNTSGDWGYAGLFIDRNSAANNYIPWSFESEYGNHSWGIVARFHIQQSSADKPAIQFTATGSNERWSLGYCTASDYNFRITQNQAYRTDNSGNDGWGTERFRINTDGTTYLGIQGQIVYFNGSESANLYGIRGRFTNEYMHLYNKVGVGHPGGWGQGEGSTPNQGLSTYGGANFAYGTGATSTFYGHLRVTGNNNLYLDSNFGQSIIGLYASTRYQGVFAMGDAYKLPIDGTGPGNLYGLAWSHPNAGGVAGNLNTHGLLVLENGTFLAAISGSIRARDDMRAPIFYDSDNTGYYLNPAGTSNLYAISNYTRQGAFNMGRENTGRRDITSDQNYWGGAWGWGTSYGTWADAWKTGFSSWDIWGTSTDHPQGSGYVHAQGIISGQHYCTSDGGSAYGWMMVGAHAATENRYWLRGKWGGSISGWVEMITSGNIGSQNVNYASQAGTASFASSAGNTSSISSAVGGTYTWTGIQYFQSNLGGYCGSLSGPPLQAYSTSNNSAFFSFHKSGVYAVNMGLDADSVLRIGGWSAASNRWQLDMSGNMTVAGDVTAYSDARVKENVKTVEDALDKVLNLRGVYYNRTDSDDKRRKVGVIAQEILEVIPEVVGQDNDGMYNVSYGNIVGVLIEAIKEQQKQIDELKARLD